MEKMDRNRNAASVSMKKILKNSMEMSLMMAK